MVNFKDIPDADIRAIQAPALILNGAAEHALEISRTLPHVRLAILPGGHGEYIGEICTPCQQNSIPAITVDIIGDFYGNKLVYAACSLFRLMAQ